MCFHTIQTKEALELENRFSAKFENVDIYPFFWELYTFVTIELSIFFLLYAIFVA